MIPSPLPVGISRVMLRPGRRPLSAARPFFNANYGWRGRRFAKHFSIDRHGEELAFRLAVAWRAAQVARLLGRKPHAKFNRPGKRRAS